MRNEIRVIELAVIIFHFMKNTTTIVNHFDSY
jgi:hypothetical protein